MPMPPANSSMWLYITARRKCASHRRRVSRSYVGASDNALNFAPAVSSMPRSRLAWGSASPLSGATLSARVCAWAQAHAFKLSRAQSARGKSNRSLETSPSYGKRFPKIMVKISQRIFTFIACGDFVTQTSRSLLSSKLLRHLKLRRRGVSHASPNQLGVRGGLRSRYKC